MSEEQLKELQEYNLEYLEAQQSEEIFGGDYTSAVELKYAELKIEEMRKELINQDKYIGKLKEEYANQLQQKENKEKEIREYIMSNLITEWDIENDGYVSGSDLPASAITPILEILDKENK